MNIRAAGADELHLLQDIERAAGQLFRAIGMVEIADDDPASLSELLRYQRAEHVWLAVDADDAPIAYLTADLVDGNLHIEQVSVHPRYARRGIGRRLIDHLAQHALAVQGRALTLTTFADISWNAPYYRRCGFHVLDDEALTPGLRTIHEHEAARGLDRWPRVCMRRDL